MPCFLNLMPLPSRRPKSPAAERRLLAKQAGDKTGDKSGSGTVRKADLSGDDEAEARAAAKLPVQDVGSPSSLPPPVGNERVPVAGLDGEASDSGSSAPRPLDLPPCAFGTDLNFVGSWQGDSVGLGSGQGNGVGELLL